MPAPIRTPRIVQPPGGGRLFLRLLAATAVLLALAWTAYDYGRRQAGFAESTAGQTIAGLRQQIRDMTAERHDLKRRLAAAERAAQVDREALSRMRKVVEELEAKRMETERRSEFLRRVIAEGAKGGIEIRRLRIRPDAKDPLRYHLTFMLVQRVRSYPLTTGRLAVELEGRQGGKDRRLSLKQLSGGKQEYVKVRFKQFQDCALDIGLPEGFEPTRLRLDFKPSGKQLLPLSGVFDWQVEREH